MTTLKQKAQQDWDLNKSRYYFMNDEDWMKLYPGAIVQAHAFFLMGWVSGFNTDLITRDKILSNGAKGDIAQMSHNPFLHGFALGYLTKFTESI